jgi:hypothetical protein
MGTRSSILRVRRVDVSICFRDRTVDLFGISSTSSKVKPSIILSADNSLTHLFHFSREGRVTLRFSNEFAEEISDPPGVNNVPVTAPQLSDPI